MVFNVTFNNSPAISWQSVLLVTKTGIPDENHWPVACYWQTLSHNVCKDINKTVLQSWRMWHKFYQSPVYNGLCFRFLFWSYLLERCFLYSCCTSVRLLHLSDTVLWLYQRSSISFGCIYLFVELSFVYERVRYTLIGILFLSCRFSTSNQGQSS
jgi:hypothetical protein